MREIRFRGKRTDTGEWVYGCLLQFKGFSIFDHDWKTYFPVRWETVGQCAGKRDRCGTQIFEGDIVTLGGTVFGDVFWDEEYASFCVRWRVDVDGLYGSSLCGTGNLAVVGNIHDNPELLEGGDS